MISNLFKPTYSIRLGDDDWLYIRVKRAFLPSRQIGVARHMEEAMGVIKSHKNPPKPVKPIKPVTVYEE